MENPSNSKFRKMVLRTSKNIVRYSNVVQNSITPLNLELSQLSNLEEKKYCYVPKFSYSKDVIDTQENGIKILGRNSSIFYILPRIFTKDTLRNIKSDWKSKNDSQTCKESNTFKMCIEECFYYNSLCNFVDYACKSTENNLKILKWFVKFHLLVKPDTISLPRNVISHIVDCMHPELNDSEFMKDCFNKLEEDLTNWSCSDDSLPSKRRLNYLYHFLRNGKDSENKIWFENSYGHNDALLIDYVRDEYQVAGSENSRRELLILQMLYCLVQFGRGFQEAVTLYRVVWNSIPDSFLTSKEILGAMAREGAPPITKKETNLMCMFYAACVGDIQSYVEPRSLKHYCRVKIRTELAKKVEWLPDALKKLGLPKQLQTYLNLGEYLL